MSPSLHLRLGNKPSSTTTEYYAPVFTTLTTTSGDLTTTDYYHPVFSSTTGDTTTGGYNYYDGGYFTFASTTPHRHDFETVTSRDIGSPTQPDAIDCRQGPSNCITVTSQTWTYEECLAWQQLYNEPEQETQVRTAFLDAFNTAYDSSLHEGELFVSDGHANTICGSITVVLPVVSGKVDDFTAIFPSDGSTPATVTFNHTIFVDFEIDDDDYAHTPPQKIREMLNQHTEHKNRRCSRTL